MWGQLRALITEALDFNAEIDRLVKLHGDRLPGRVGAAIGTGGDGNVYAFGAGGAIKVGRLNRTLYGQLERVLTVLEKHAPAGVVEVYEHGTLNESGDDVVYYYVMERLRKLTPTEGTVIGRLTFNIQGPDDPTPDLQARVDQFAEDMSELPWSHLDPSPNNVMKSRNGEFKFVDIESFVPGID